MNAIEVVNWFEDVATKLKSIGHVDEEGKRRFARNIDEMLEGLNRKIPCLDYTLVMDEPAGALDDGDLNDYGDVVTATFYILKYVRKNEWNEEDVIYDAAKVIFMKVLSKAIKERTDYYEGKPANLMRYFRPDSVQYKKEFFIGHQLVGVKGSFKFYLPVNDVLVYQVADWEVDVPDPTFDLSEDNVSLSEGDLIFPSLLTADSLSLSSDELTTVVIFDEDQLSIEEYALLTVGVLEEDWVSIGGDELTTDTTLMEDLVGIVDDVIGSMNLLSEDSINTSSDELETASDLIEDQISLVDYPFGSVYEMAEDSISVSSNDLNVVVDLVEDQISIEDYPFGSVYEMAEDWMSVSGEEVNVSTTLVGDEISIADGLISSMSGLAEDSISLSGEVLNVGTTLVEDQISVVDEPLVASAAYDSGNALSWDGIDDNGDLTGSPITLGTTFSASFHIKPSAGWSGGEAIFGKNGVASRLFYFKNSGTHFGFMNDASEVDFALPVTVANTGGYFHVAVIKTATDKMRVYVEAVESANGEQTVNSGTFTFDKIGRTGSSANLVHAAFDDIVIWNNTILTGAQITDLSNGVDPLLVEAAPYVHWDMNGSGTDTEVIDSGSLGQNFTKQNFPNDGTEWVPGFTS